jgi:hypothetical protein
MRRRRDQLVGEVQQQLAANKQSAKPKKKSA